MTYAATLPWPTEWFQSAPEPKAKNSAAGNTSVKMTVRRLRSIRLSSNRRTVVFSPPNGGTRRAVGSMVLAFIGGGSFGGARVGLGGLVGLVGVAGQRQERLLDAAGGDLQ